MLLDLDHVGVAVRSLEDALKVWKDVLGLEVGGVHQVPSQNARVAFLPVGGTCVELLEPTSPDGALARFLEARGEGVQHLCFRVADIRAALERLKAAGVRLIDEQPREGARGRVAFLHPKGTTGVLVELVEPASSGGDHPERQGG
ncbi:MAG: methylmalonyl-CoA epimerase [Acetobacteraceae bacterium]|nr:methylmalonyl-CoA epimerase [Acetobacteraceae bacterium]